MRVLVLSFYFEPDLCAGSFRTTALAHELAKHKDIDVDVITTLPNRYASFLDDAREFERNKNLSIRRIPVASHSSDIFGQSRAFLAFAREALRITKNEAYDIVFATSSRLLTAALGARVSRRMGAPLYLDIRDIFVDTIRDIMARPIAFAAGPLFSLVEKWTIRSASTVNLVSRGFESYFADRYPDRRYAWYTNGIDDEFIQSGSSFPTVEVSTDVVSILYAGNIGEGQCLHDIVPGLADALRDRVRFVIIGDGGRRKQLESELAKFGTSNVKILPPVCRDELIANYKKADVLFLHLGDYDAFKKVLPSKLFEYGAMGKPVLAGVSGYAARFVNDEISNSSVFSPGDVDSALKAFDALQIADQPRPEFVDKYSRKKISAAMARDIVRLGKQVKS